MQVIAECHSADTTEKNSPKILRRKYLLSYAAAQDVSNLFRPGESRTVEDHARAIIARRSMNPYPCLLHPTPRERFFRTNFFTPLEKKKESWWLRRKKVGYTICIFDPKPAISDQGYEADRGQVRKINVRPLR